MKEKSVLFPRRLCVTYNGDLAHTVGRLVFSPGQPMLVEHVGGLYLAHSLCGAVLTNGYGPEYDITHIHDEDPAYVCRRKLRPFSGKVKSVFSHGYLPSVK